MEKRIVILAGPNGAGKTTFAKEYLPHEAACRRYLNVDLIAAGISPFDPDGAIYRAARIFFGMMKEILQKEESFAFETTLSSSAYARMVPLWQSEGYHVTLIFLQLNSPELAVRRVENRVAQGGHHVDRDVILRRFYRGRHLFETVYKPVVDLWARYDNSYDTPVLLEEGEGRNAGRK